MSDTGKLYTRLLHDRFFTKLRSDKFKTDLKADKYFTKLLPYLEPIVSIPILQSITVVSAYEIIHTYDLDLNETIIPSISDFAFSLKTGTGVVVVSGKTVTCTVTVRYYWGDAGGTSAYTKGANPITSTLGGEADSFTATAITNNVALDARTIALVASYGSVPTDATKALINKTIVDLKAKTFTKITTLVLPMHTSNDSLLNIIAATYTGQLVNAPAFTAGLGWDLNGISQYINPVYNPRVDGGLYELNSGSFMIIFNEIVITTGGYQLSGSRSTTADGADLNRLLINRPTTSYEGYSAISNSGNIVAAASTERTSGIYFLTRTTNLIVRYFVNKILKASSTNSAVTKIPDQSPLVGGERQPNTTVGNPHKGSVGGYLIGAGMTDQEIADTTDIIQYFRDNIQATL